MKTETVRFVFHIGLEDADPDGFPAVVAVHDRMKTLHDQNLQLLEAFRKEQVRAAEAEDRADDAEKRARIANRRFNILINILGSFFFAGLGLFFGYCLSRVVLKWIP